MDSLEQYLDGFSADGNAIGEISAEAALSPSQVQKVLLAASQRGAAGAVARSRKTQFTLQITRATAAISASLPVPIYGPIASDTTYARSLKLPPGVTLAVTKSANGVLTLTYTEGANVDVISIVGTYPYVNQLEALRKQSFNASKHKYTYTPAASADDMLYSQVQVWAENHFGQRQDDNFSPGDRKNELDNLENIATVIDKPLVFDDESYIILSMPAVASSRLALFFEGVVSK